MQFLKQCLLRSLCLAVFLFVGAVSAGEVTGSDASKIKVACVGDSITQGSGFPGQLQKLIGDGFEVQNFGHSGRTLLNRGDNPYTKSPRFQAALEFNPDVVIIKLGTNDSKSHNWRQKKGFIPDYLRLISRFRQLPSKPVVWICKPVPAFAEGSSINGKIVSDEIIPRIDYISKEAGAPVIDLYTPAQSISSALPGQGPPKRGRCR